MHLELGSLNPFHPLHAPEAIVLILVLTTIVFVFLRMLVRHASMFALIGTVGLVLLLVRAAASQLPDPLVRGIALSGVCFLGLMGAAYELMLWNQRRSMRSIAGSKSVSRRRAVQHLDARTSMPPLSRSRNSRPLRSILTSMAESSRAPGRDHGRRR